MLDQNKPDGGMKRTRVEANATAAELREFLSSMKGKSPQEMLGAIAQSSLMRATTEATLWTAALMAGFTLVPYFLKGDAKANTPPAAAKSTEKPEAAKAEAAAKEAKPANTSGEVSPDMQRAAKAMGIDETKTADPKTNPREKDLDSLLDAVK